MNTTRSGRFAVFAAAFIAVATLSACAHSGASPAKPAAQEARASSPPSDEKVIGKLDEIGRRIDRLDERVDGLGSRHAEPASPRTPPETADARSGDRGPAREETPPPEPVLPIAPAQPELKPEAVKQNAITATALLFIQDESGNLRMACTATAFDRKGKLYRFVSAAHCVSEDNTMHERAEVAPLTYFLTFDEPDKKNFYEAKVVAAGYMHRGDDFAVLEVTLDIEVPTVPLAAHDPALDEDIINVASPLGLGKQLYRGHVSMAKLNRPVIAEDIN